eukprot:scaffold24077_cov65-Phaeocystis_antarctica.AAC.1
MRRARCRVRGSARCRRRARPRPRSAPAQRTGERPVGIKCGQAGGTGTGWCAAAARTSGDPSSRSTM